MAGATFRCAKDTLYQIRIQTTDVGGLSYSRSFTLKMTNVLTHPEPDTLNIDICEGERYDFFGTPYTKRVSIIIERRIPICAIVYMY